MTAQPVIDPARRYRLILVSTAGVAGVALIAAVIGVSLVNSGGGMDPVSAPGGIPHPSSSPASSSPSSAPSPSSPEENPPAPTATLDPHFGDVVVDTAADGSAELGQGMRVELVSVTETTITGTGIGSTTGPGIVVTVRATNGSAASVEISPVVNAYFGDDRVPLSPESGEEGLPSSVAASSNAEGSYVFSAGSVNDGDVIWITVGTGPDSGLVVFEYR